MSPSGPPRRRSARPRRVAVVCGEEQVSYAAVESRANRLAHTLRRLGVGPEVRAGVYLERSVELVVGALAILKAGGAFLPIDPAYPAARVQFMIEDAQATVIVSTTASPVDCQSLQRVSSASTPRRMRA